jgi:hyperosmotically inducible protein
MCVPANRYVLKKTASFEASTFIKKAHTMKIKLASTCFVIGTALAAVAAHAADGDTDRMHPIAFVKDSVITTKIKAKLAEEKLSTLTHVKVDTDAKGAVVLGGNVTSQGEADKAVSIARATEGVTSVKSSIQIKKDK